MADASTPAKYCLTLICPPTVDEKLLDLLLANAGSEVFTSTPTHSHGSGQVRLSATEQVMGGSRAMQVNVLLTTEELEQLREMLQRDFAGTACVTGRRCWPLMESLHEATCTDGTWRLVYQRLGVGAG